MTSDLPFNSAYRRALHDFLGARGEPLALAREAARAAQPERFDLVLTDQTMPRLTGLELARHIHGIRPQTPVILYTGYGEEISDAQLAASGVGAQARKPQETAQLGAQVGTHQKQKSK